MLMAIINAYLLLPTIKKEAKLQSIKKSCPLITTDSFRLSTNPKNLGLPAVFLMSLLNCLLICAPGASLSAGVAGSLRKEID